MEPRLDDILTLLPSVIPKLAASSGCISTYEDGIALCNKGTLRGEGLSLLYLYSYLLASLFMGDLHFTKHNGHSI